MSNLIGIIASYAFIIVVIIVAKLFEKIGKEASRKFIHIALCNWWFIAMYFFTNAVWASIVPLSFVIINYISYKKNIISVMERDNQDGLGTVYYAISLFVLAIISFGVLNNPLIGLAGSLVMGYGDGLAAILGRKISSKEFKVGNGKKTLVGSATMFIITFVILAIFLIDMQFWYIKAIIASIIITIVEAVSVKGTDNLTVPIITSGILYLLMCI